MRTFPHEGTIGEVIGMRTWLAGGLVAALVVGSAIAAFYRPLDEAEMTTTPVERAYRTTGGDECAMRIEIGVVGTGDPGALRLAAEEVATMPFEGFVFPSGVPETGEPSLVTATVAARAELAVREGFGPRVRVVATHEATCVAAPEIWPDVRTASEDFGREPSDLGVPADWVAFFRASSGHICEVQIGIVPDGAADARVLAAAREYLRSLDVATLDYSAALIEVGPSGGGVPQEVREADAVVHTAVRLVFEYVTFDETDPPAIATLSDSRCDDEPTL